ncbi:hypothetical protein CSC12_3690 [Klebsiella michiganensis]|nr:hypothetical protein CSC12_3690 [Klebsiella michiganensis]
MQAHPAITAWRKNRVFASRCPVNGGLHVVLFFISPPFLY